MSKKGPCGYLGQTLQNDIQEVTARKDLLMPRGYDTSALHWKDEILRIRHLEAEIADMQKEIDRQKQEAAAAEERFQRTKNGLGITG